jgi:hypothetical protein
MRQLFVLACVLLVCVCVVGSAQPAFAQNDGQIHAGICRSGKCGAAPDPCNHAGPRGLLYTSPPSGHTDLHHDPSTGHIAV